MVCRVTMGWAFSTTTSHSQERLPPLNSSTPGRPFDSIFAEHKVAKAGQQHHNEYVVFDKCQVSCNYFASCSELVFLQPARLIRIDGKVICQWHCRSVWPLNLLDLRVSILVECVGMHLFVLSVWSSLDDVVSCGHCLSFSDHCAMVRLCCPPHCDQILGENIFSEYVLPYSSDLQLSAGLSRVPHSIPDLNSAKVMKARAL